MRWTKADHRPMWNEVHSFELLIASDPTVPPSVTQETSSDLRKRLHKQISALINKTEVEMLEVLALPNPPINALKEGKELLDGLLAFQEQVAHVNDATLRAIAIALTESN